MVCDNYRQTILYRQESKSYEKKNNEQTHNAKALYFYTAYTQQKKDN